MNCIPAMTDRLGKYWSQPAREVILIDDIHAVMDLESFDGLSEYSSTLPSGVYPGKMWKAHSQGRWMLRWFGIVEGKPTLCSNNQREILRCES